MTVLQDVSPEALTPVMPTTSELTAGAEGRVVVLPDAEASGSAAAEEESSGFNCGECETIAKSRRRTASTQKKEACARYMRPRARDFNSGRMVAAVS